MGTEVGKTPQRHVSEPNWAPFPRSKNSGRAHSEKQRAARDKARSNRLCLSRAVDHVIDLLTHAMFSVRVRQGWFHDSPPSAVIGGSTMSREVITPCSVLPNLT